MIRALCLVLVSLVATGAFAGDNTCSSLAAKGEGSENNFRPPAEATVVGKGTLFFYKAPSVRCKMKGAFTMPGSYVTVYKLHSRWANVMFIGKDGEDIVAWVQSNRLKIVGQYGRNP